ncbi:MAG TPA: hypothetical protein VF791_10640, partial [Pyrinomonadaceae bacterium]
KAQEKSLHEITRNCTKSRFVWLRVDSWIGFLRIRLLPNPVVKNHKGLAKVIWPLTRLRAI